MRDLTILRAELNHGAWRSLEWSRRRYLGSPVTDRCAVCRCEITSDPGSLAHQHTVIPNDGSPARYEYTCTSSYCIHKFGINRAIHHKR